jgi:CRP/FNR family cyclic AMP-dependent transcriptional regulator
MDIQGIEQILAEHPVFAGLGEDYLKKIAGCAANVRYMPGDYLAREGQKADHFYLVRYGSVALEAYVPGKGALTIQTRSDGDLAGWSSLFPPYEWHFDVRALSLVRAVSFDATCVRGKSEEDPRFGYEILNASRV